MKTILCYGDSNTYGYIPAGGGARYPRSIRFPGRLAALLGEDYLIIEEGCSGRTTVFDDPEEGWKNGRSYLLPCLHSHKPIDLVILMLGSNDLKETFHASPEEIASGAGVLLRDIKSYTKKRQGFIPKLLLVCPPAIGDQIRTSPFYGAFTESAVERSKCFPACFEQTAKKLGADYLNAQEFVSPSLEDSLHLNAGAHEQLAKALFDKVLSLLAGS